MIVGMLPFHEIRTDLHPCIVRYDFEITLFFVRILLTDGNNGNKLRTVGRMICHGTAFLAQLLPWCHICCKEKVLAFPVAICRASVSAHDVGHHSMQSDRVCTAKCVLPEY